MSTNRNVSDHNYYGYFENWTLYAKDWSILRQRKLAIFIQDRVFYLSTCCRLWLYWQFSRFWFRCRFRLWDELIHSFIQNNHHNDMVLWLYRQDRFLFIVIIKLDSSLNHWHLTFFRASWCLLSFLFLLFVCSSSLFIHSLIHLVRGIWKWFQQSDG